MTGKPEQFAGGVLRYQWRCAGVRAERLAPALDALQIAIRGAWSHDPGTLRVLANGGSAGFGLLYTPKCDL